MESLTKTVVKNVETASVATGKFLVNPYVKSVITLLTIINLGLLAHELHPKVSMVLKSRAYRSVLGFAATFISIGRMDVSLLVSVAIYFFQDFMRAVECFEVISPTFNTSLSCIDVKLVDLLNMTGGDIRVLKAKMYSAGVPLNLSLSDENAALIATFLIQKDLVIPGTTCSTPK
jgi:hypothetical protein